MVAMSDISALDLEPGGMVGGYTLIERLGAGAMGSVWRVEDGGGQTYAMKILRDSLNDDNDLRKDVPARERLRREAMAMRKIRHPGVCQIVDMELDDAVAFIVTELIDGRNLKEDVAVNGRYVGDDLERLASRLIAAVKAVHAAGIVHRDIKPTNVMVAARGPVLVDFGIAMGEGESHVTRTGLVMGTPGFIAPEIIEGAESSEATDWWSCAAVLAFAATGQPVFGTKPMMTVLERAASGNANLAGLPAATTAALRSALDPHPENRCTPDELLDAIRRDAIAAPDDDRDGTADAASPAAANQPAMPNDMATATAAAKETQVMRPFGASFSATDPPQATAPLRTDPATAGISTIEPTRVLQGTAPMILPMSETNPRTLWLDPSNMAPGQSPGLGQSPDEEAMDDDEDGSTPPTDLFPTEDEPPIPPEVRRESRSDLIVGLAVSAIFVIAIITAIIGL